MSSGKSVPQIPDTSGITDRATKRVVDAMVDMLQVRNGDKGNGDAAFLTKVDIKGLIGDENYALLTASGNTARVNRFSERQDSVAQTIRTLQNQIGGSPLSVYLAQRIGEIDRPKTGLKARLDTVELQAAATDTAFAAVQTQVTTLTNSFAAQATLVNTVQARLDNVDGANASIEQKFQVLVDRDNHYKAQYTVKADIGGYIVGFGFLAEDNGNGPSSLFLVRSDTFAIGAPGLNAQIPFIVKTTPHVVNGVTRPPGVYIEQGFLGNFVADSGHIGNATVDTLKIADNAVIVPASTSTDYGTVISTTWKKIGELTVDFGDFAVTGGVKAFITGVANCYAQDGAGPTQIDMRITLDGPNGEHYDRTQVGTSLTGGFSGHLTSNDNITLTGVWRVGLEIRKNPSFAAGSYETGPGNLSVLGAKR